MNSLIGTLAFLSIFHLVGGVVLGATVRQWLRGRFACNSIFMLVWGAIFGCAPLGIGLGIFGQHSAAYLLVEVAILVGTILVTAFTPSSFLELFDASTIAPIAFGGIFMLVGIGVAASTFASDPVTGVVVGVVFAGSGGLVFILGLQKALKA